MVTSPLTGEGERHSTALLVSGVLRREVEDTEREGGTFNRDEARRLFETIFADDNEIRARRKVFEADFEGDAYELPGYPALGQAHRRGDGLRASLACCTATTGRRSRRCASRWSSSRTRAPRCSIFRSEPAAASLDALSPPDVGAAFPETVRRGRKRVKVFKIVENLKSRKQVDGWLMAPGFPQGGFLYLTTDGQLVEQRQSPEDRSLINRGPSWATPYVDEELAEAAPMRAETLDHMLYWFSNNLDSSRRKSCR